MALLQNPYRLNWKATTPTDQLESTRALNWELEQAWIGYAPAAAALRAGTLANLTRDHVAWAARCRGGPPSCSSQVRALLAQLNLVARALWIEPGVFPTVPADAAPRMALVSGLSKSLDIISWASDQNMLLQAIARAIRTDPVALVRLEVLRAVGLAPIPLAWVPVLLDAIERASAVLGETPFPQKERLALAAYLQNVAGRLVSIQATAAQAAAVNTPFDPGSVLNPPPANVPDPQQYLRRDLTALLILGTGAVAGMALALLHRPTPARPQPSAIGLAGRPPKHKTRHPKNRTQYASLDRIAADPRVEQIHDEDTDGIWISLAPGYNWEGASSVHEWNVKDLISAFKAVEEGDSY